MPGEKYTETMTSFVNLDLCHPSQTRANFISKGVKKFLKENKINFNMRNETFYQDINTKKFLCSQNKLIFSKP